MKTAVLFVAFNKPETTKKVFEEVRKAKPEKLYITIDGARNKEEDVLVKQVKEIVSDVDWKCDVKKLFRKENNGTKNVYLGVDWMFETEDSGIVLEDDCLPSQDFFRFCEEMLERYEDDDEVMHINGTNFTNSGNKDFSYYFSDYPSIWGWATWKRAWAKYDFRMKEWHNMRKNLKDFYLTARERFLFRYLFNGVYAGANEPKNWGHQWTFCVRFNEGLAVIPFKNLVRNIGCDMDSANFRKRMYLHMSIPIGKLSFPLRHPTEVRRHRENDLKYVNWVLKWKARNLILKMIKFNGLIK